MPISPNIPQFRKSQRGFSLVELLVVCALISLLGTVLYATFYQGINLWKRSQVDRGEFRDIFFIERLNQDLRNAFTLSSKEIRGSVSGFEFYTLLSGRELGLTQTASKFQFPCRVRYYFDGTTHQIFREVQSYSQILTDTKEYIKTNVVFDGAKRVEWTFMGRNKAATLLWQKTWEKDYLPNAVKLSIEYEGQKQIFIRTLSIPGGGRHERLPQTA